MNIPKLTTALTSTVRPSGIELGQAQAKRQPTYNYLFVFEEGLRVTNVPVFELKSLLGQYAGIKLIKELNFVELDKHEGDKFVFDSFVKASRDPADHFPYLKAGGAYIYVLEQSCIVSTDVKLDLAPIVANSGYIHSAGKLLLAGRWDNIELQDINNTLNRHGQDNPRIGLDFWTADRVPHPGLEGLSIDSERYFIDNLPFSAQSSVLTQQYPLAGAGSRVSIFRDIYHDKSDSRYPESGDSIYMLAFADQVRKFSPLQILDEWKPYWKGIDTTPQALMAAMLNIAGLRPGGRFIDIFGGMGTCMIEATKVRPGKAFHNDTMEVQGAMDNYTLLTTSPAEIKDLVIKLAGLKTASRNHFETLAEIARKSLEWNGVGVNRSYPEVKHVEELMQKCPELTDFSNRLYFYMLRRGYYREAHLNGKGGLIGIVDQNIKSLQAYSANMEKAMSGIGTTEDGVILAPSFPQRGDWWETLNINMSQRLESSAGLPFHSIDAVVTDAPYGYGTDAEKDQTISLYQNFIATSFDLLKPSGSLIFCVLDKVRTGKPVSSTLTTVGVTEMVRQIAAEKGILFSSNQLEGPEAPMYWKSGKKLNRGIVRVRIDKTEV